VTQTPERSRKSFDSSGRDIEGPGGVTGPSRVG
jgi:hypothetical protein